MRNRDESEENIEEIYDKMVSPEKDTEIGLDETVLLLQLYQDYQRSN